MGGYVGDRKVVCEEKENQAGYAQGDQREDDQSRVSRTFQKQWFVSGDSRDSHGKRVARR